MNNLQVTHHTVVANGIRQHYVEAGEGPPVVLLLLRETVKKPGKPVSNGVSSP